MKTQLVAAGPMVRVNPPPAPKVVGPGLLRLVAEYVRVPDSAPQRRLPYPVIKLSELIDELIEEWLRHRIQNPACQPESGA